MTRPAPPLDLSGDCGEFLSVNARVLRVDRTAAPSAVDDVAW